MLLTEGKKRVPCPEGTHLTICYAIIDLGTQAGTYKGKPKKAHKILFGFETPNQKYVFDEKEGPQPFGLWSRFTASLSERAKLRGILESWRGRKFTDEEVKGFDPKILLGKAALSTVIHKDGYANIQGMVKLPKEMGEAPKPINELVYLTLEKGKFDEKVFRDLGPGLRDTIAESPEFKALGIDYKPGEEEDGDGHPTAGAGGSDDDW
jgi:hypothetical protein